MFRLLIQCLCINDYWFFAKYSDDKLIFGWHSLIAVLILIILIAVPIGLEWAINKNKEKGEKDLEDNSTKSEKVSKNVEGKFSIDFTREQ